VWQVEVAQTALDDEKRTGVEIADAMREEQLQKLVRWRMDEPVLTHLQEAHGSHCALPPTLSVPSAHRRRGTVQLLRVCAPDGVALCRFHAIQCPVLTDGVARRGTVWQRGTVWCGTACRQECGDGIEMPERLFVEAYIMRPDISHTPGWETGRPSEPDYMDLNLHSTRHHDDDQPTVVVYQVEPQPSHHTHTHNPPL
jgi:hypothetical protein